MRGTFEPILLFGLIVFITFLGILGAGFTVETQRIGGFVNQSNENLTLISTGDSIINPTLCDYTSQIPVIGAVLWGLDCAADYISYLFNFITLNSTSPWLQGILTAAVAVIIFLGVRIYRGN